MNTNFDPAQGKPGGFIARVLTVIGGVLALGAALMFSLAFFAVVAVVGLIFWLYFWWKTRALRQRMRDQINEGMRSRDFATTTPESASGGDVIDGEAVRVADERSRLGE